jgi:hypothetical protein
MARISKVTQSSAYPIILFVSFIPLHISVIAIRKSYCSFNYSIYFVYSSLFFMKFVINCSIFSSILHFFSFLRISYRQDESYVFDMSRDNFFVVSRFHIALDMLRSSVISTFWVDLFFSESELLS